MKTLKLFGLVTIMLAIMIAVPAMADFGTTASSITVQNTGTSVATVSFTFYDASGSAYSPNPLTSDGSAKANPFTLNAGESYELYMPNANLADGKYSLVISSDQPVVAVSNVIRDYSGTGYNGTFAGFSEGATTVYMPSIVYDYYDYYSELSIQNTGSAATNITVDYSCPDGTYQDTASGVAPGAAAHFSLADSPPTGMTGGNTNGACSATISASEPVAAVDNQYNQDGFLQTYNGFLAGATALKVTALYNGYYGWNSSLDIQNVGAAATNVTVTYSDGETDTCTALAVGDKCFFYMPGKASATTLFAASISAGEPLVAVHNAANNLGLAQTSNSASSGGTTASIPAGYNGYYGWNSSWACINLGTVDTDLTVAYAGYGTYNITGLGAGESHEQFVPNDSAGPTTGQRASVTVTSSATDIACTYNANQDLLIGTGDWALAGNAFAE